MSILDYYSLKKFKKTGDSNYLQGKFDKALQDYERLLSIDPNFIDGWYMKSEIFFMLERFEEAKEAHEVALKIGKLLFEPPLRDSVWFNKGKDLYEKGKFIEASVFFNRGLIEDLKSYETWVYKGLSLDKAGYRKQSLYCIEQAITILTQLEDKCKKEMEQNDTQKNWDNLVKIIKNLAYTREIKNRI